MALWGGRFEAGVAEVTQEFGASLPVDKHLYKQDIAGSKAHAKMLAAQGIISAEDEQAIAEGLTAIEQDIDAGNFTFDINDEDIHMSIESELTRRIGEAGKRLHTGRSRNDQVATDTRLGVKALAKELGPSHITVNCVAPGVIDTEMNGNLPQDIKDELAEETPLERLGTPEDVAQAVWFLASPAGDFFTGQVLAPNGGLII